MTDRTGCEEVRAAAPELALGVVAGDERARMLDHIARCPECRESVVDLANIGDELLTLAPNREPPIGFESRVISRLKLRRGSRRWIAAVAAAAVLGATISAGAVLWSTREDRDLGAHYREALSQADGRYFGARELRTEDNKKVGNVFIYAGRPSWVFVSFEDVGAGSFAAELETGDGETLPLGEFELGEKRTWGTALPIELKDASEFRVMRGNVVRYISSLDSDD
jgi:hypothetical protein